MFCPKCGTEMPNDTAFCPRCGTAMNIRPEKKMAPNAGEAGAKGAGKKIPYLAIGAITLMLILVFVLFRSCTGSNGPEKLAVEAVKTEHEMRIKDYYKLLSPPYLDYMVGDQGWFQSAEEFQQEIETWAEEDVNIVTSKCGEDYEIDYKTVKVEEYNGDELISLRRSLENDYDYEADKIKAAANVTVSIRASGSEGGGRWTQEISCVKIGGSWYVHRPGF